MRSPMLAGVLAFGLLAMAGTAHAQIISTSVPKELGGMNGSVGKPWSFHAMYSPLAKWGYGEQYFNVAFDDPVTPSQAIAAFGVVDSKPLSNALFAGEFGFALNEDWSASVGAWHNKVGSQEFEFSGFGDRFVFIDSSNVSETFGPTSFATDID